jgi:hypothetical protein
MIPGAIRTERLNLRLPRGREKIGMKREGLLRSDSFDEGVAVGEVWYASSARNGKARRWSFDRPQRMAAWYSAQASSTDLPVICWTKAGKAKVRSFMPMFSLYPKSGS